MVLPLQLESETHTADQVLLAVERHIGHVTLDDLENLSAGSAGNR